MHFYILLSLGLAFLLLRRDSLITRLVALLPTENKNVQIALTTVMLNVAVASCEGAVSEEKEEAQVQCVTSLAMLLFEALTDPEARYRALVAMGTLLASGVEDNMKLANELGVKASVELWRKEATDSKKIRDCGAFVIRMLP